MADWKELNKEKPKGGQPGLANHKDNPRKLTVEENGHMDINSWDGEKFYTRQWSGYKNTQPRHNISARVKWWADLPIGPICFIVILLYLVLKTG